MRTWTPGNGLNVSAMREPSCSPHGLAGCGPAQDQKTPPGKMFSLSGPVLHGLGGLWPRRAIGDHARVPATPTTPRDAHVEGVQRRRLHAATVFRAEYVGARHGGEA